MKKTKIMVTLGPASIDKKIIKAMVDAGMDCIRINASHGDFQQYETMINNVREVKDLPIILDTEGPNVRVRASKQLKVEKGSEVVFGFNGKNSIKDFNFNYNFFSKIKVNDLIYLNDGLLCLRVKQKLKNALLVEALNEGLIYNGSGVNLPSVEVKLPILTAKDKELMNFARKMNVDFIALSFTRSKEDIFKTKKILKDESIGIIAKIESKEGLKNFDSILAVADGIMVARGDLGVEIPAENVPLIQKDLVQKTQQAAKIAIVATQMLSSMINNPRPTRAETSDVANAILDCADCVMLSNETTVGKYPVESVAEMTKIALTVEPNVTDRIDNEKLKTISDTISKSLHNISRYFNVDKILVITKDGFTARAIARFKPKQDILAITNDLKVKKKLSLVWGVIPVFYPELPQHDRILNAVKYCVNFSLLNLNDSIVVAAGLYTSEPNICNQLGVFKVKDLLKYYESEFNLKISNTSLVCANCGVKLPILVCCKKEMVLKDNKLVCEVCGKEIPLAKAREIYEKSTERKIEFVKETLASARKWFDEHKPVLPFIKSKK